MSNEKVSGDSITYRLPDTDGRVVRAAAEKAIARGLAKNVSDFHRQAMLRAALEVLNPTPAGSEAA